MAINEIVGGKKVGDFTAEFPSQLLQKIVELEEMEPNPTSSQKIQDKQTVRYKNDKRYLVIAMMHHLMEIRTMEAEITNALTNSKWKSFFMLHSLIEFKRILMNSTHGDNITDNFLLHLYDEQFRLPRLPENRPKNTPSDEDLKRKLR